MTIDKELNYFAYSILFLIFLVLTSKLTNTAVIIIGAMFILLILLIKARNILTLRYFIICTVFQNIILILTASSISSTETTLIIILKELVVYFSLVFYFIQGHLLKPDKKDLIFISFVIVALLDLVRGNSLSLGITALRQIMVVFTGYYFGKSLRIRSIEKVYSMILFYTVLVGIIGLILYFWSEQDWLNMGFAEFWINKSDGNTPYSFTNFYTYDLGSRLKRLVSTFADPLACSHFIGIGFLIVFLACKGKNYFLKVFLTMVMVMGITKSSVVLIISTFIVLNYSKIKSKTLQRLLVAMCILLGIIGIGSLSTYTSGLTQSTSISNHLNAFLYGLKNASMLGNGLGTTGYNSHVMGLEDYDAGYNESFFSLCMGQVGIIGVALIYAFLISCLIMNYRIFKRTGNRYVLISFILSVDLLIETLFSASSVSMLGTGLYCVLSGIICSFYERKGNIINEDSHYNFSRST